MSESMQTDASRTRSQFEEGLEVWGPMRAEGPDTAAIGQGFC